jgi:hypothetical protein
MMMKKNYIRNFIKTAGFLAAAAAVMFAGCNLRPESGGAVLSLSLDQAGISRTIGEDVDTVRLYLVNENGAYYTFSEGVLYYESAVPGTIEVEVPAGSWTVALELGKQLSNGALLPTDYGVSTLTEISPGVDNNVAITTADTPFAWSEALAGAAFNGVVTIDSGIYVSTSSKLYEGTGTADLEEISPVFNYSEYAIESISQGTFFNPTDLLNDSRSELWVNTDKGIVPLWPGGFNYSFQNTQFPVVKSGGYFEAQVDADNSPSNLTIFYKTPSAFGGLNVENTIDNNDIGSIDPSTWAWNNNDDFTSSFTGELVYEFFIHGGYTYFATKIGTFRMDNAVTGTGGSDFFTSAQEISIAGTEAGSAIPIYGLDLLSTAPSDTVILATQSGVFTATLTGDDSVISDLQLIPGTAGKTFTQTAASDASGTYAAAVSTTGLFIFKKEGSGYIAKEFPVYTGLPGAITAVEFKEDSHVLVAAGESGVLSPDGGIVQIDAAALSW